MARTRPVTLVVGGEEYTYNAPELTPDVIREKAREVGIGKFIVSVNNKTVETPADFPRLRKGDVVKVLPYDEWGSK